MQVNYPNDHDFIRIAEIKHAAGQKLPATTIVREYPQDYAPGREPYYPIPAPDVKALYIKYADRTALEKNVTFVGRLATYRYYNMDQVAAMALAEFDHLRAQARVSFAYASQREHPRTAAHLRSRKEGQLARWSKHAQVHH